ncbi:MAG TPA: hypothetical protein PKI19_01020 [Elusimicrobiales bacterium]|nr:hypothetical protein [Elusimicrobiales bacterium]
MKIKIVLSLLFSMLPAAQAAAVNKAAPAAAPVAEEVTWAMGVTTAAATITRPGFPGRHPAVLFVAGSGPTDRNWTSPLLPGANGSAAPLALKLAEAGFVVLRYDKRFTGPYAAQNMQFLNGKLSFQSHMDEIAGAVARLRGLPDVDAGRIFALTNSEGAIHALNYQLQREPAFAGFVLTGAPGRSMGDVMRGQIAAQVAALPGPDAIMAGYDKLVANFLAGQPFTADPALPREINSLIGNLSQPANLPFIRELLTADASALLARSNAPVLVLIGKKDVQIDWQLDGAPLEKAAAGRRNAAFAYPENTNHLLKFEPKPRSELTGADGLYYNAPGKVLDEDAVRLILDWLKAAAVPVKK